MSDTNAQPNEQPSGQPPVGVSPAVVAAAPGVDAAKPLTSDAPAPMHIVPRLAERKMVNGKAQIALGSGFSVGGKLVDLSEGGVCVMLDDPVTIKKVCNISCNIFQNGKSYAFSLASVVAYCVLVSGRGYKVGFQFGPRSPAVAQTIADVLKSS